MSKDPPPMYGSGAYWRSLSDPQLEEQFDGSPPGNMAYVGASEEMARRSAERDRRQQLFWIKITFAATIILGIAGIVATILG